MTVSTEFYEYNYREVPIWALPQIANLRRKAPKAKVEDFVVARDFVGTPDSFGILYVRLYSIHTSGLYQVMLKKSEMNNKRMPSMYWISD